MIAPAFPTVRLFYRNTMARELIDKSPAHRQIFEVVLNRLAAYFGGRDPYLDELTDDAVKGVMARLLQEGHSRATCNQTRTYLLEIMRFAMRPGQRKLRKHEIDVQKYKEIRNDPRAWTTGQVTAILAAAREVAGIIPGLDRDGTALAPLAARLFWTALLLVIYDSGLRITATMRLVWDDVDFLARALWVRAETQKQRAAQYLDLSEETFAALDAIRTPDRDLVFPWPWDRNVANWPTLDKHYRRILQAAGLPIGRGDLFHRIRRTNASYIKAAGGNPTERLGHSSEAITRRYLDPSIAQSARQSELLPRPSENPPVRASSRFSPAVLWPAGAPALVNTASTMDEDWAPPIGGKQRLLF
jgi:integrase